MASPPDIQSQPLSTTAKNSPKDPLLDSFRQDSPAAPQQPKDKVISHHFKNKTPTFRNTNANDHIDNDNEVNTEALNNDEIPQIPRDAKYSGRAVQEYANSDLELVITNRAKTPGG